ncbi:MAG: hypothetical protein KIS66_07520 [Fimbriimonadaceae bacterium]|nr:hypothetical protein [Fimbriimonadaceae bacterium]
MILVVSTSSPWVSVAVHSPGLALATHRTLEARNEGHRVLYDLVDGALADAGTEASWVTDVVADVGPGGFTSVRIGVTFAKLFAYLTGCRIWGVEAFDLIGGGGPVIVPSRKGEWFVRCPHEPARTTSAPPKEARGYGRPGAPEVFPDARLGAQVPEAWRAAGAMTLVPFYLAQPSISRPKTPYRRPGETVS